MSQRRQTLAVLVDNEAGVLSQVSRLFSRKGYNIESLAVGTTTDPNVSRITIEVVGDDDQIKLLSNQLGKLFPVHSIKVLTPEKSIRRELVLFKVRAATGEKRNEIIQIGSLTLAMIGDESKIEAIQKLLDEFEVLELVRTGVVALERGQDTIYDETKEKGEFNYGKNVL